MQVLEKHNPDGKTALTTIYAGLFITYIEAESNIMEHGAVVAHPRTGMPIENPYLKVRTSAINDMQKMRGLKTAALWEEMKKK